MFVDVLVTLAVTISMVVIVNLHLYFRPHDGARKGGCSLLPVGAGKLKELVLPLGWCL
jgi:hypothetical protein